jgi:hypothetical protein
VFYIFNIHVLRREKYEFTVVVYIIVPSFVLNLSKYVAVMVIRYASDCDVSENSRLAILTCSGSASAARLA